MASSSKNMKGTKMLVRNKVCKAHKLKLHPSIAKKEDPMVHIEWFHQMYEVRTFYHCSIQDLGTFEMNEAYKALCDRENLQHEHQHLEEKGFTHIRNMLKKF